MPRGRGGAWLQVKLNHAQRQYSVARLQTLATQVYSTRYGSIRADQIVKENTVPITGL